MKNQLLSTGFLSILIALVLQTHWALGQNTGTTKPTDIVLDFPNKEFLTDSSVLKKIKKGQFYRLKITGLNQNLYKIGISATDSSLSKALQPLSFGSLETDALTKLVGNLASASTLIQGGESMAFKNSNSHNNDGSKQNKTQNDISDEENKLSHFKARLDTLAKEIDRIKFKVYMFQLMAYKQPPVSDYNNSNFDKAEQDIIAVRDTLLALNKEEAVKKIDSIKFYVYQLQLMGCKQAPDAFKFDETLQKLIAIRGTLLASKKHVAAKKTDRIERYIYQFQLIACKQAPFDDFKNFKFDETLQDIIAVRDTLIVLEKEIAPLKTAYEKFSAKHQKDIKTLKLEKRDTTIKEGYSYLLTTIAEASKHFSADKSFELLVSVIHLQNNTSPDYLSLPFQVKDDQTRLKIELSPREEKFNLQTYRTELVFPLTAKKYASVGASFYTGFFKNESYSTVGTRVDSTVKYSIVKEKDSRAEIGSAVLMRIGRNVGSKSIWGYHFTLGPGISISDKIKPRFLFGGGLSTGEKHRLAFDAGLITGYVDRKSDAVDLNNTTESPGGLTISRLGFSGFISIGYFFIL